MTTLVFGDNKVAVGVATDWHQRQYVFLHQEEQPEHFTGFNSDTVFLKFNDRAGLQRLIDSLTKILPDYE